MTTARGEAYDGATLERGWAAVHNDNADAYESLVKIKVLPDLTQVAGTAEATFCAAWGCLRPYPYAAWLDVNSVRHIANTGAMTGNIGA